MGGINPTGFFFFFFCPRRGGGAKGGGPDVEAEEEGPCFRSYAGRTQRLMPPSPVPCFRLPGLTGERFASLLETKTYFLSFL